MEKSKKKKSKKKEVKEVCETFVVNEGNNEKIVKTCGEESLENHPSTTQIESQNKTLKRILIGLLVFSLILLSIYFIIDSIRHFEYEGVKFDVVKEGSVATGNLILYQTSVPVTYKGKMANYNFYLRKDPRELDKISFDGKLLLTQNIVLNMTEDFNCDGDGVIAIANMVKMYGIFGINVMKDGNASCDSQGRYSFIQIQPGEKTNIQQTGPSCYILNVNNCEILDATEKLMVETFIEYHNG